MKNKRMFACINCNFLGSWPFEIRQEYKLIHEHINYYKFELTNRMGITCNFNAPKNCFEEITIKKTVLL